MELNELSFHYNLHQLINTPTHILRDSELCIDLLFTSQPNFLSETGIHASLFPRCHRQIYFAKVSRKVFYPSPYERLVRNYSKAELSNIGERLSHINCKNALKDLNVKGHVEYLTSCILKVLSNFVPNKIIRCRDKDPPWITEEVKKICYKKAKIYENYVKNYHSAVDKDELVRVTSLTSNAIIKAKEKYFHYLGNKMNYPQTDVKFYWSIPSEEKFLSFHQFYQMGISLKMYVRK